jgi:hypothetical protein
MTEETDLIERMERIARYEYSSRDMLIHSCDLGKITLGDIQDLCDMARTATADPLAIISEWRSGYMFGTRAVAPAGIDAAFRRYCEDFPGSPAARAAAVAQGRVKALVWDGRNMALTVVGAYTVWRSIAKAGWRLAVPARELIVRRFQTESDAKAAAQADYTARILSAFEAPPADEVARLRLCVAHANDTADAAIEQVRTVEAERDALKAEVERLRGVLRKRTEEADGADLRAHNAEVERDAANARAERLKYVLDGVAGAIDTGRHEPLMIWRDQIDIARAALAQEGE